MEQLPHHQILGYWENSEAKLKFSALIIYYCINLLVFSPDTNNVRKRCWCQRDLVVNTLCVTSNVISLDIMQNTGR